MKHLLEVHVWYSFTCLCGCATTSSVHSSKVACWVLGVRQGSHSLDSSHGAETLPTHTHLHETNSSYSLVSEQILGAQSTWAWGNHGLPEKTVIRGCRHCNALMHYKWGWSAPLPAHHVADKAQCWPVASSPMRSHCNITAPSKPEIIMLCRKAANA